MAVVAAAGAAETAYLTAAKLLDAAVACPTSGCEAVLTSPYASLFGLPLPLLGFGAYASVAAAAAAAARCAADGRPQPRWLDAAIAGGVGCLAGASAVLLSLLSTRLAGSPCAWCYASAAMSGSLAALLVAGLGPRRLADAAGPGLGGCSAALALLAAGYGAAGLPLGLGLAGAGGAAASAAELELPYASPAVTADSSPEAVELAARLRRSGARMYGAFWCSHCYDQKQAFGRQAMAEFPYVECFPNGWKRGVKIADACEEASVKAFPTWVINGAATEGQLELSQLEEMLNAPAAEAAGEAVAPAAPAAAGAQ